MGEGIHAVPDGQSDPPASVFRRMSLLDKLLPLWILIAMIAGVGAGYLVPGLARVVNSMQVDSISLPIAIGLIWMMYPPLAAVNYRRIGRVKRPGRVLGISAVLNWLVGPFLMFALAWIFLPDLPAFRDGVILIGLARCIAMVLVWNMLAGGDSEYAAVIVAVNALFQILLYSAYAFLFLNTLSGVIEHSAGASGVIGVNPLAIAWSVSVFLGVPLAMGIATRISLVHYRGEGWYEERFLPRIKPTALLGLLFTLAVMFSLEGRAIVSLPVDMLRVAAPLLAYFLLMFIFSYLLAWKAGLGYEETATTSFTAASNNFELAIAVAVSAFGLTSGQAFAAVVGPLIEVPMMIGLVYLSLFMRGIFFRPDLQGRTGTEQSDDDGRRVKGPKKDREAGGK